MDLKKLRSFAVVSDYNSFSKAAVHLSVSQSLLSKQISDLEGELGVRLFYRNGRGALLTPEGEKLLFYARRLDSLVDETVSAVRGLKSNPSGTVVLGISAAIGATLTVPLIKRAKEKFPLVSLNVVEALSGYVHEWLNTGRIDLAVIFDETQNNALQHDDLVNEDLLLVSPADSPATENITIDGSALRDLPMCLPSRMHRLRKLIDSYTGELGFHFTPVAEIDALVPIVQAVKAGLGHSILPYGSVVHDAEVGRLRIARIVGPRLFRKIYLATSMERFPTSASRAMIDILRDEVKHLDKTGNWRPTDAALKALRSKPLHKG